MTKQAPQQQSRPWVAVVITMVLCSIAIHQQATAGVVADSVLGALVVLALFWAGRSIEGLDKLVRK